MSELIQFAIVTVIAAAALAALIIPYFRKPASAAPGCAHCPTAKRQPMAHAGVGRRSANAPRS